LTDCTAIALAFAMITFPAVTIIPSIYGMVYRSPRLWSSLVYVVPITGSCLSLMIAVTCACIDLLLIGSLQAYSLCILIFICTLVIIFGLYKLVDLLFQLSLVAEFERAKKGQRNRALFK
jgi:hypothetical protein